MNTLNITPLADGRVRVTIHSEGERDQHVDLSVGDFRSQVGELERQLGYAQGQADAAYRDPEPPAVGEPPTTTPGTDA